MNNIEIGKILGEIGEYIAMDEGVSFRARAYEKAAEIIAGLPEDIVGVYHRGGRAALEEIPGIGKGIAETVEELVTTGKSKVHERLKKATPVDLSGLSAVEGLGPQKIQTLYKELGVTTISKLEKAARAGKIRALEGFGARSEEKIIRGIEFLKQGGGRFPLGDVMPRVRLLEEALSSVRGVEKATTAGSVRRRKETVGDIDMLVIAAKPKLVMDFFIALSDVAHVIAHGPTKSAVKLKNGLQVDLRVVPKKSYGAALNYFTGSKDHNIALRQIAQDKGLKLNEYGLFKGKKQIAGKTEKEIYSALGLVYIEPELREMTGEVEASRNKKLPNLIGYTDLQGDLQVQTNWTDGNDSIKEMAMAAQGVGLRYMVVTDHTKRLAMTGGLDEKRIVEQMKEIDRINAKLQNSNAQFKILKGSECDILKDGMMDLPNGILAQLDVVGASVHSYFNLSREEQTKRIITAMRNPHVDIIFHPTGRKINQRPPYELDMDAIIAAAKETGTVLEIDAFPDRLDLRDEYIRRCVERGVKLAIDSDAHDKSHFAVLEYGIAQARRGWARREDIINAWPVEKMLSMLKP